MGMMAIRWRYYGDDNDVANDDDATTVANMTSRGDATIMKTRICIAPRAPSRALVCSATRPSRAQVVGVTINRIQPEDL